MTCVRRITWFESIIKNDDETTRQMILNGQDVNMRAGPTESDLFTYYYSKRCNASTVFFDCQHQDEACRPTGAHVAIFFNSLECLRHISMAQVCVR